MTATSSIAVAYYRVSTNEQATLGYSLDAQRSLVRNYIEAQKLDLVAEHTEAESGFGRGTLDRRPELKQALQDCRAHKARLIIATLDRLARNVVFIATLVETRIDFVALDIPDATPFMIHIYAAVAEEESRKKGEIVKASMALAKSLGTTDWGREVRRREDARRARAETLRPIIDQMRAIGLRGAYPIARELNRLGISNNIDEKGAVSLPGKPWTAGIVSRVLKILGYFEASVYPWGSQASNGATIRAEALRPVIADIRARGACTNREIAQWLNERNIPTVQGKLWDSERIRKLRNLLEGQSRRRAP
jgi:DNA invertase Pin-like site-specific DNA recombinase